MRLSLSLNSSTSFGSNFSGLQLACCYVKRRNPITMKDKKSGLHSCGKNPIPFTVSYEGQADG